MLGTGTGAVVTVSSSVADAPDRGPRSTAAAPAPEATGGEASTAAAGGTLPLDTESPGPTLTAVPDGDVRQDDGSREDAEAAPAPPPEDRRPAGRPSLLPSTSAAGLGGASAEPSPTDEPDPSARQTPQTRAVGPEPGGTAIQKPSPRPSSRPSSRPSPRPSQRPTRPPTPTPPGSPEPTWAPPADTSPPETTLSEGESERGTVVLTFGADEAASFWCSLDGSAWTSCASPTTYSGLGAGWHTFAVVAADATGNVDPTPAATSLHVKGGGPR